MSVQSVLSWAVQTLSHRKGADAAYLVCVGLAASSWNTALPQARALSWVQNTSALPFTPHHRPEFWYSSLLS